MSKTTEETYSENLALYVKLVATNPEVERKGKTMPYTSRNGHMFSFLTKEGALAMRLPKDELENFLEKFNTERPVQYGSVMKEYALVPDSLLKNTEVLQQYFDASYEYIGSLKPKPTKKKKK